MIEYQVNGARNAPMLSCDLCGELIREAGKAAVVFDNYRKDGELAKVLYVHKGKIEGKTCHEEADSMITASGGKPGWQELKTHLCHLLHNVGFPAADAAEYEIRHREMGE
jgi:hypothetical protein